VLTILILSMKTVMKMVVTILMMLAMLLLMMIAGGGRTWRVHVATSQPHARHNFLDQYNFPR